jgi:hypothetical protein
MSLEYNIYDDVYLRIEVSAIERIIGKCIWIDYFYLLGRNGFENSMAI